VIRIEISAAAYAALAATATRSLLDARRSPQGGFYIWLDEVTLGKLKASRRPGEDDGDAILRIALEGTDAT
jgi:hypothetical protein